jgi:hypothetical protein
LKHSKFLKHLMVGVDMLAVLKAPVMAVTLLYLPSDILQGRKEKVSARVGSSIREKLDVYADVQAAAYGEAGTAFAGWTNIDALMAFSGGKWGSRGVSKDWRD